MIDFKKGKAIEKAISFLVKEYSRTGFNKKPVILHSLNVAFYLMDMGYDFIIVQTAVLHDLVEDSRVKTNEIYREFGKEIGKLVESLTFKAAIRDKEEQYKELFTRVKRAGRKSLIVKCADMHINSLYLNLVCDEGKERFLLEKLKYFLDLSKTKIGEEPIWRELKKRAAEEEKRINNKHKKSRAL